MIPNWLRTNQKDRSTSLRDQLRITPLSAELHFELAEASRDTGNLALALAEFRTAKTIDTEIIPQVEDVIHRLDNPLDWDHNTYFRLRSLVDKVLPFARNLAQFSILDVGGGQGLLAQLAPMEWQYCLAEPSVNGIDGTQLPFENEQFDFVIACHVLEHVPIELREAFLSNLVRCCRVGVLLLNPIEVSGTLPQRRMQMILDITGADWAREHLECGLPTVDSVQDFADRNRLDFQYSPNGFVWASLVHVYASFFATQCGSQEEFRKVNRFLNELPFDQFRSEVAPNAGTFLLLRR